MICKYYCASGLDNASVLNSVKDINEDLKRVHNWALNNKLSLNGNKSQSEIIQSDYLSRNLLSFTKNGLIARIFLVLNLPMTLYLILKL